MKQELFDFSVYTIVRRDKLDHAAGASQTQSSHRSEGPGRLREGASLVEQGALHHRTAQPQPRERQPAFGRRTG